MDDRVPRLKIGPFLFLRAIEPGRNGDRWLAIHERDDTAHVVHRIRVTADRLEQRRFVAAVDALSKLDHPHVLPITQYSLGTAWAGNGWVVTPYTGNGDGLVTLELLAREKGGRIPALEVERAAIQMLETIGYCHARGHGHGVIHPDEVLVDRRGSLSFELYGLRRLLSIGGAVSVDRESRRDEVRSVVAMVYRLLTGLAADEPRIPAARLVPRLSPAIDAWIDAGLDPVNGFESADEALGRLAEGAGPDSSGGGSVLSVLGRVRQALGSF